MKICPKCGRVLSYNSYFGAYICAECNWEDARLGKKRNMGIQVTITRSASKTLIKKATFAK